MKIITKEEIIKALIIRSAYGVKVDVNPKALWQVDSAKEPLTLLGVDKIHNQVTVGDEYCQHNGCRIFDLKGNLICKMYLRSLSTMTKEEREFVEELSEFKCTPDKAEQKMEFYYSHHLDYQGWIKIGLAEEAPINLY